MNSGYVNLTIRTEPGWQVGETYKMPEMERAVRTGKPIRLTLILDSSLELNNDVVHEMICTRFIETNETELYTGSFYTPILGTLVSILFGYMDEDYSYVITIYTGE